MDRYDKYQYCLKQLKDKLSGKYRIGLVLGSGLGDLATKIEDPVRISYASIDSFPKSTAPGHAGSFVAGRFEGVDVIMMQGRIHLYEGYDIDDVVLPIRLMVGLGIEALILTNAAGAINLDYKVGDFCILRDQISTFVPSPLRGKNVNAWGVRFPDMSKIYDEKLRQMMKKAGEEAACKLHEGVYIQFPGPAYESPAEIVMARALGADMAGMSTAVEAIAARHMSCPTVGVSLATNMAAGCSNSKLDEQEVIEEGKKAAEKFEKMIRIFIKDFA